MYKLGDDEKLYSKYLIQCNSILILKTNYML